MREFLLHSIPFIVLGAMALSIYYFSSRMAWAFGASRWLVMAAVGVLTVGAFVSMVFIMRSNQTSAVSHFLSNASNILIGVLMFAVCVTLVVDLVGLFIKIAPRTFGFVTIGMTTLLSFYSLWNASHTRVYEVDITLPNLADRSALPTLATHTLGTFGASERRRSWRIW